MGTLDDPFWECQAETGLSDFFQLGFHGQGQDRSGGLVVNSPSLCSNCHYNLLIQTDGCDSTRWLWLLYLWNTVTKTSTYYILVAYYPDSSSTPTFDWFRVCEDGIRACTAWRNVASEWPFPVLKSFFFSDNEPLPVWPNILGRRTSWMNRKPGPEWRKKWKWQFEWCSDKPTVESIYYPLIAFYL